MSIGCAVDDAKSLIFTPLISSPPGHPKASERPFLFSCQALGADRRHPLVLDRVSPPLQVVAAELVAAEKGAGMMILVASKFQLTDIVVMGIILIGVIGYGIDILMRLAERRLVPWKGHG